MTQTTRQEALESTEYHAILSVYGDECAVRSGVPKINHINEGLLILEKLHADLVVMKAWCIHPIMQDKDMFMSAMVPEYNPTWWPFDWQAVALAVEYRNIANGFLCTPETDNITVQDLPPIDIPSVSLMLIADKIQNKKDFMTYHHGTHARSDELLAYFDKWLAFFGFSDQAYREMCMVIDQHTEDGL